MTVLITIGIFFFGVLLGWAGCRSYFDWEINYADRATGRRQRRSARARARRRA